MVNLTNDLSSRLSDSCTSEDFACGQWLTPAPREEPDEEALMRVLHGTPHSLNCQPCSASVLCSTYEHSFLFLHPSKQ